MNCVKFNNITTRELEILELIVQGYSNYNIAKALKISEHTVKAHIESLYRKLEVHNKVQATIYAFYNGIIDVAKL